MRRVGNRIFLWDSWFLSFQKDILFNNLKKSIYRNNEVKGYIQVYTLRLISVI